MVVVKRWRKRTCKRKDDESEPVSTTDDSGKVKFAREVCYKVKDGTPCMRIQRGNTMRTPIAPSPIFEQNKI